MVRLTGLSALMLGAAGLVSSTPVHSPELEVAAPNTERDIGDVSNFCAGGAVSRDDVTKCRDYINAFGNGACAADSSDGYKTFCIINGVTISGTVQGGAKSASSYCSDAAWGITWVLENCPVKGKPDMVQTGIQTARGNGQLAIWTTGNK